MSEYPLCSCDEWWRGPGRHSPECHVVAKFKKLERQLSQARDHVIEQERGIVGRERRIAELEQKCEKYHAGKVEMKIKIADLVQQLAATIKTMRDSDELANAGFYDDAAEVIAKALKEQDNG